MLCTGRKTVAEDIEGSLPLLDQVGHVEASHGGHLLHGLLHVLWDVRHDHSHDLIITHRHHLANDLLRSSVAEELLHLLLDHLLDHLLDQGVGEEGGDVSPASQGRDQSCWVSSSSCESSQESCRV